MQMSLRDKGIRMDEIQEMTKETGLAQMRQISRSSCEGDIEQAHRMADHILLARLIHLGEMDLVEEFKKVKKWYA
jgi:hypothetical protein